MEKELIINSIRSLTDLLRVFIGAGMSEEISEISKKILDLSKQL